jgi:hypothetical protein
MVVMIVAIVVSGGGNSGRDITLRLFSKIL